jgi:hypothetical protein
MGEAMTELSENIEQLRPCPICHGPAQKFDRTIGPGVCCNGKRDCPWYRVVVPLEAWQRLPRVSDVVRRVIADMQREVELCEPDRTLVSLGRVTRWRQALEVEIDEQVGVWMNAYADACLKMQRTTPDLQKLADLIHSLQVEHQTYNRVPLSHVTLLGWTEVITNAVRELAGADRDKGDHDATD